jgi:hypothetical protein
VSGFREFNTVLRPLVIAFAVLMIARAAPADEIRKWTDAEGRLHYSVDGSDASAAPSKDEPPVLQGRTVSAEEKFSVHASLRRKEIESKLAAAARDLDGIHERMAANEARTIQAWAPTVTQDPAAVNAQRDAFLAVSQFDEDKAEERRRLKREERAKLKEIVALWKEFEALDASVTAQYGSSPEWWRKRLSCGHCPTLAEADVALHGAKPTPKPETSGASDDENWDDDEQDWQ